MRCITYSNDDGSREGAYFTDDTDTPATEFIPYGCTLAEDFDTDDGFPSSFPLDYNLEKTM